MNFYQPQSRNIVSIFWIVAIGFIGAAVITILNKTGNSLGEGPASTSTYLGALFPMLYVGLPVLLLAGFIFSVFSIGREETKLGRNQALISMIIMLVIAYVVSYNIFTGVN